MKIINGNEIIEYKVNELKQNQRSEFRICNY